MALNIRAMTVKVITARSVKRRRAMAKARCTASPKRSSSRLSWPNAWTTFIAPSVSDTVEPTSAMRSCDERLSDPEPLAEQDDRPEHERDADDQHRRQLGRQREQIDDPADAGGEVAKRDRDAGADHLLEDGGVGGQPRGDLGRPVLLEEARRQGQQVLLHRNADVGDRPLAQPGDEIEAHRGGDRQHDDDHQQILERLADRRLAGPAGAEAAVDHPLEAVGDGERRRRRQAQEEQGRGNLLWISRRRPPDELQVADARSRLVGGPRHRPALAAPTGALNSPIAAAALQHGYCAGTKWPPNR